MTEHLSNTESIKLLITIDTECDHTKNWSRSNPLTFHSITEGLPNRLQPAFESVGAVPTYLLTVEVMEDNESVHALRALKGSYEFGTHLHAGFIEPEKKHFSYAGVDCPDFQCNYAPGVEFKKLENLTNLFQEKFSYKPTAFRAGRYGAGANTIESLEKLGYCVDTSVTPYIKWKEPRGMVDFTNAPEQPYFPEKNTIISAGDKPRDILEIPVTMKPRWFRGPSWFRPWFTSVERMKQVVRYHLQKYANRRVLVINMMFHSMEVIAGASPYPQTEDDVKRFIDEMIDVLDWCKNEGIEFSDASSFYNAYTGQTKPDAGVVNDN